AGARCCKIPTHALRPCSVEASRENRDGALVIAARASELRGFLREKKGLEVGLSEDGVERSELDLGAATCGCGGGLLVQRRERSCGGHGENRVTDDGMRDAKHSRFHSHEALIDERLKGFDDIAWSVEQRPNFVHRPTSRDGNGLKQAALRRKEG